MRHPFIIVATLNRSQDETLFYVLKENKEAIVNVKGLRPVFDWWVWRNQKRIRKTSVKIKFKIVCSKNDEGS